MILKILLAAKAAADTRKEGNLSALRAAAGAGYVDCIDLLLEAKAEVEAAEVNDGATALQCSALVGHADCVARLIAAKADVNAPRKADPRTPLEAAAASEAGE